MKIAPRCIKKKKSEKIIMGKKALLLIFLCELKKCLTWPAVSQSCSWTGVLSTVITTEKKKQTIQTMQ